MKKQLGFGLLMIAVLFFFVISPAAGITYYKPDGTRVDAAEFEKIVHDRQPVVEQISRNGYATQTIGFEDPVRLRQKRIEQWKKLQESKH